MARISVSSSGPVGEGALARAQRAGSASSADVTPRVNVRLLGRVVLATAWAGLLVLAGLELCFTWAQRFPSARGLCVLGGVTVLAMGQFVFASLVADRLFPKARLWVAGAVQFLVGVMYVGGVLLLVLMLTGAMK
jgi:hypothetical protein